MFRKNRTEFLKINAKKQQFHIFQLVLCISCFLLASALPVLADVQELGPQRAIYIDSDNSGTTVMGIKYGTEVLNPGQNPVLLRYVQGLLRFDLTAIPSNATVSNAILSFNIQGPAYPGQLFFLNTTFNEASTWDTLNNGVGGNEVGSFVGNLPNVPSGNNQGVNYSVTSWVQDGSK